MARVTMKDVAREASTSSATVSKVLTQGPESSLITDECRRRVLAACEKLGYVRQHAARSLRTGRSFAIGGMMAMQLDPREPRALEVIQFHAPTMAGMLTAAHRRALQFVAIAGNDGATPLDTCMTYLRERRIDGLIVPGAYPLQRSELAELSRQGLPVVFAGWPTDETALARVQPDDCSAIPEALAHFRSLGHKRIAWLGPEDDDLIYASRRRESLESLLHDQGLAPLSYMPCPEPPKQKLTIDEHIRQLVDPLSSLLTELDPRPTAMLVYDEFWALALYAACARLNLKIPEDMSVITFDDIYAATALPALSVISLELFDVGAKALDVVADVAEKKRKLDADHPIDEYVATRLILRDSTTTAKT